MLLHGELHVKPNTPEAPCNVMEDTENDDGQDKYCPRGKIKKLEFEMWNLKVKGNDVVTYSQRFQELALMMPLSSPLNSWGQKRSNLAERQADNKRKSDDTARNNQNQQPNKRQNTGRAYAAGNGDRRPYGGPRPLLKESPNVQHWGNQRATFVLNCGGLKGILTKDCQIETTTNGCAVVQEFPEVFSEDLPVYHPSTSEFRIDLVTGATPVARAHMISTVRNEGTSGATTGKRYGPKFIRPSSQPGELRFKAVQCSNLPYLREAKISCATADASKKGLGVVLMQREKLRLKHESQRTSRKKMLGVYWLRIQKIRETFRSEQVEHVPGWNYVDLNGRVVTCYGTMDVIDARRSHSVKYSIHPGSDKMYQDMKRLYFVAILKANSPPMLANCIGPVLMSRRNNPKDHRGLFVQPRYLNGEGTNQRILSPSATKSSQGYGIFGWIR
ncbi:hypothetical protein Tco_0551163 [Tanacetum coccineum]